MENDQRNARIFGVLFVITFLTSIPALAAILSAFSMARGVSSIATTSVASLSAGVTSWAGTAAKRARARRVGAAVVRSAVRLALGTPAGAADFPPKGRLLRQKRRSIWLAQV